MPADEILSALRRGRCRFAGLRDAAGKQVFKMRSFLVGRRSLRVAATLSSLALLAPAAWAVESRAVADLLAQPAQANIRAAQSLQLSVARAGNRLVSVGERGLVLLSDDGGKAWRQARSVPVSVALTQVCFVSDKLGWAVGHSGVVLSSSDGGETWQRQLDGVQAAKIIADNARTLAAAGGENAGRHLREAEGLVQDGPDKPFLSVFFADAQRGWIVGAYGMALATADGGKSWQSLMPRIPNAGGKHLYAINYEAGSLLLAGEQGVLFRSTDNGASFQKVTTPYAGTFFGALPVGTNGLFAYGLRGNAWRSDDAGANWSRIELAQPVTLTAALRLTDGTLLLADESGRLLRGDAGATRFVALPAQPRAGLTSMVQAADGALIVSGARGVSRVEPATLSAEASK